MAVFVSKYLSTQARIHFDTIQIQNHRFFFQFQGYLLWSYSLSLSLIMGALLSVAVSAASASVAAALAAGSAGFNACMQQGRQSRHVGWALNKFVL